MDSPCTHIYSALSNSPLTLRDLDEIGLDRINEAKEKKKAALENFGIQSVLDLLETYPRRYIDRTNMITIADLEPGVPALVIVTVESSKLFTTRNGKPMVKVVVTDGQRKLSITFFNQKWREKELQPGMEVAVFGKPDLYNGALQMTNPVVDRVGDQTGRILPIYPQSEKSRITTKELGKWIVDALKNVVHAALQTQCRNQSSMLTSLCLDRLHSMTFICLSQTIITLLPDGDWRLMKYCACS